VDIRMDIGHSERPSVAVQGHHGKNRKETAAVNTLFDRVHWCALFPVLKAAELIG